MTTNHPVPTPPPAEPAPSLRDAEEIDLAALVRRVQSLPTAAAEFCAGEFIAPLLARLWAAEETLAAVGALHQRHVFAGRGRGGFPMTAEPRDVEESLLRRQVRLMMALCDSGLVRIEPTDPDDGVGVAWIRVMDAAKIAAADREKAELRGEVERLTRRLFPGQGESYANEVERQRVVIDQMATIAKTVTVERDDLRAQLAAAQAQLAEARSWLAKAEPHPDLNGNHFAGLAAALSAAPQPEPERVEPDSPLGRLFDYLTQPEPPASAEPARCGCARCDNARRAGESFPESLCRFMIVCATCGNKRCPRAAWHGNECTGSNEPGQPGSNYPAVRWADMFGIAPDFDGPTEADR